MGDWPILSIKSVIDLLLQTKTNNKKLLLNTLKLLNYKDFF